MINFFTDETKFIRIMRFAFIFVEMLSIFGLFPDYLSAVAFIAAIAGLINIGLIIKNNPKRLKNIFVYCWIYIIVMMIISTYINKGFDFVLYIKYDLTVHFVWFSLYFLRNDNSKLQIKKEIILFAKMFVLFTVFFSIVTLIMSYQNISFEIFGNTISPKIIIGTDNKGIYSHHNLHGIISSASALSSIYLVSYSSKIYKKLFYILCFIIEIVFLYFSGSRNAQIGFILAFVIFCFYLFKNRFPNAINLKLLIVIIPIALIVFASIGYITMREYLSDGYFSDENYQIYMQRYTDKEASNYLSKNEWIISRIGSDRYSLYKETLIMSLEHPFVGNGHFTLNENALETFPAYSFTAGNEASRVGHSNCHLFFLQAFYETGIVGLILSICMAIKLVIIGIKTFIKENNSFYGYLVSIALISLIWGILDTGIFFSGHLINSIIWMYFGALFYSYLFKKKKGENR